MTDDASKLIVYTGPSMNPTLKAPDLLHVVPYEGKKINLGDVIAFLPPGDNQIVTHRIVSVNTQGVRTRGDNNADIDSWTLIPDCIIGHVVRAQRGNRRRVIYGGLIGRLFSMGLRAIHIIDFKVSLLLHPAYLYLSQTGVFRQWLPASMKIQTLSFNRPNGLELQLIMGRRVIGRLLPGAKRWKIRRPFRLFVDEASLPGR